MSQTGTRSGGARGLVWRALERAGADESAVRAYEKLQHVRGGPTAWRNLREHDRVRLLAAAVLSEDSDCIDVGAHSGLLLDTFVSLAPRGRHIAYEPVPAVAAGLAERYPGVDVRRAAVSDEAGETSFVVHRDLPTRSSMRSVGYSDAETETITVPVERLDDALPPEMSPALLKIDVEGAEHLVLRGAMGMLTEHRPLVLFEHQNSTARHYDTDPGEIFDILTRDAGMRVFDIEGQGPYTRDGFRSVVDGEKHWNFFARP